MFSDNRKELWSMTSDEYIWEGIHIWETRDTVCLYIVLNF